MARTKEPAGWTSQFREIILDVEARLHDLRATGSEFDAVLDAEDYGAAQALGAALFRAGAAGVVYPSVRYRSGQCVGLFYPDLASNAVQGRHLDYHWNGERVDLLRDAASGQVYRVVEAAEAG